jgi:hypothetical protein
VKALLDYVLFPVSLVLSVILGVLACYAYRGVTPRLPVPEPLFIIGACSVILVTLVVDIVLKRRGE